jgi:hypothetical protein
MTSFLERFGVFLFFLRRYVVERHMRAPRPLCLGDSVQQSLSLRSGLLVYV